ncbi:lysylphosphatidylglycerol synthase transmembrane domain-containing protein [Adlercreutzia aquisgranensis]|uniref:lysylphosphatidylglycerol synthase transmembrane domain-containing protein n=1 Tax=Adlercreutzia aquisgranensis TaxID=2941323 RepID=UPI00203BBF9E|nr:lysylphosphatidylglycerol synthase transmembrane domain-containing protein [Adlercreutzia aquisgranensis]
MKRNAKKLLVAVVFIAVLAVVLVHGKGADAVLRDIREGQTAFLAVAIGLQVCKYACQGMAYRCAFASVGSKMGFGEGFKLVFETFFVDTIAPSMNVSGEALVVSQATKRGDSTGAATAGALLMQAAVNAGFLVIMVAGFAVLVATVGLQPGIVALGLAAVVTVGGMVAAMAVAAVRPKLVLKIAAPFLKLADRVAARFHKGPFDRTVAQAVDSYASAAGLIESHKAQAVQAIAWCALGSAGELGCFASVCLAFNIHVPAAWVCGYVVATLAAMVSIVPQGVGIVEAASIVVFTLFGVHQATGLTAIAVYRAFVFWLPFLAGALVMGASKLHRTQSATTPRK